MTDDVEAGRFFAEFMAVEENRDAAIHDAYQQYENAGQLGKVVVHRYLCHRGCVLMTVIKLGKGIFARTRDYKLSPGLNEKRSVPEARARGALDGNRHWPGHTFEVKQMESWGPSGGFDASCRHGMHTVLAKDVLAVVEDVNPGHPGKPTLL